MLPFRVEQQLMGAGVARSFLMQYVTSSRAPRRVLDIGCGTSDILDHLPIATAYLGIETDARRIETARRRHGARHDTRWMRGSVEAITGSMLGESFDLVMCIGVLHHMTDSVVAHTLRIAREVMTADGRFVALEPCWLSHQDGVSRWVMKRDRGALIRPKPEWDRLLASEFNLTRSEVLTGLLRIPYIHILMDARSSP